MNQETPSYGGSGPDSKPPSAGEKLQATITPAQMKELYPNVKNPGV